MQLTKQQIEDAWATFLKRNSKKCDEFGHRDIGDKSKNLGGRVEIDPNSKTNLDFYVFSEGYRLGKNANKSKTD